MSKRPAVPLLTDDVEKLIGACNQGRTGLRNRALIDLLHRSGLRISEALALMPSDLESGKVRVRHGKGDRDRVAGIVGGGSPAARRGKSRGPPYPMSCLWAMG